MKKILLVIGLLSYGPSMCAMTGILSALSPFKTQTPIEKIDGLVASGDYQGIMDLLKDPRSDAYFDIPSYTELDEPCKTFGLLMRKFLNPAELELKKKYFSRGGKSMLESELVNLANGLDLPNFARKFAEEPLYAACVSPFDVKITSTQTLADIIIGGVAKGNVDAQTLKNAYTDDEWNNYQWVYDETYLNKVLIVKNSLTSDEFMGILKARKDDVRAFTLISDIKTRLEYIITNTESSIGMMTDLQKCTDYRDWLTSLKATGIDLPAPKTFDYFLDLYSKRYDALDRWKKDTVLLRDCLTSAELTDEGLRALMDHKNNPYVTPVIKEIVGTFRSFVIMKEMAATSTLASIARLEKWLNGLKAAGVVISDTVSIDAHLAKLTMRKNALIAQVANPNKGDADKPATTSRFTLKRVAIGLGLAVGSYLAYTKFKKQPDVTEKTDTAPAV